jgi:hypothetical protein
MREGTGDWLRLERLRRLLDVLIRGPRRIVAPLVVVLAMTSVVAVGLDGAVLVGTGSASGASGPISDWTAAEAPLPTNADGNPFVTLGSVTCTSDGSCVATGDYTDTSGNQQGLIETFAGSAWTAAEAPLPSDAGANPRLSLGAVVCPADGSCVATGDYTDTSGSQQGLIETLASDTWTPMTAPLPSNAGDNPFVSLEPPACSSDGTCVVTGDYTDTSNDVRSTIETLSEGTWTAQQAPLPSNAGTSPGSSIGAPACPADGSCVAVVDYNDTTGNVQSSIDTLSGGHWSAMEAPLPSDDAASGHERNLLGPVSCPAVGSCVAVGSFTPTTGNFQGFIETLAGGSWTPLDAPLPANAPSADAVASLGVVTCPTPGTCVAVGWYYDTSGSYHVIDETLAGGTWTPTEEALPAHPAPRNPSDPGQGLGNVTCQDTGSCMAVGSYFAGRKDKGIIETLTSGSWSTIKAPLTTKAASDLVSTLDDVTCSSGGSCLAVGSSGGDPLVETLPGGEVAPSVSSADEATFTVGASGTFSVTATGTPLPVITKKGRLPKGLRFTAGTGTATIAGTPTGATGTFPITIEAKNGVAPTASQFLTLTVTS